MERWSAANSSVYSMAAFSASLYRSLVRYSPICSYRYSVIPCSVPDEAL